MLTSLHFLSKSQLFFIAPRAIRSLVCVCTHSPTQLIKLLIISWEKLLSVCTTNRHTLANYLPVGYEKGKCMGRKEGKIRQKVILRDRTG